MRRSIAVAMLLVELAGSVPARGADMPRSRACAPLAVEPLLAPGDEPVLEDDFAPGLMVFIVFAVVVLLMLAGAGAALALVCIGIAACLALLGIVTTSTLAGLRARRPRAAFRVLFLQIGGLAGAVSGAGCGWLATLMDLTEVGLRAALLTGSVAGLLFGVAVALLFNRLWGTVLDRLVKRCKALKKTRGAGEEE